MWVKNKSTTPSIAFPFALNQNKSRYALWRIWNKEDMLNRVSMRFTKCSMTQF